MPDPSRYGQKYSQLSFIVIPAKVGMTDAKGGLLSRELERMAATDSLAE